MTSPWANGNEAEDEVLDSENQFRADVLKILGNFINPHDFSSLEHMSSYVHCVMYSVSYQMLLNEADVLIKNGRLPRAKKYEYAMDGMIERLRNFLEMMGETDGRP